MACPLLGGLSSFGVSFIRGFTVFRTMKDLGKISFIERMSLTHQQDLPTHHDSHVCTHVGHKVDHVRTRGGRPCQHQELGSGGEGGMEGRRGGGGGRRREVHNYR